eukprot:scaffold36328_cov46-Phaeocystis_antarctica.AAC.1
MEPAGADLVRVGVRVRVKVRVRVRARVRVRVRAGLRVKGRTCWPEGGRDQAARCGTARTGSLSAPHAGRGTQCGGSSCSPRTARGARLGPAGCTCPAPHTDSVARRCPCQRRWSEGEAGRWRNQRRRHGDGASREARRGRRASCAAAAAPTPAARAPRAAPPLGCAAAEAAGEADLLELVHLEPQECVRWLHLGRIHSGRLARRPRRQAVACTRRRSGVPPRQTQFGLPCGAEPVRWFWSPSAFRVVRCDGGGARRDGGSLRDRGCQRDHQGGAAARPSTRRPTPALSGLSSLDLWRQAIETVLMPCTYQHTKVPQWTNNVRPHTAHRSIHASTRVLAPAPEHSHHSSTSTSTSRSSAPSNRRTLWPQPNEYLPRLLWYAYT